MQLSIHLPTEWPSATIYPHAGCPSAAYYPSAAIYPHAEYPSAAICPSAADYPLQPYIRMLDVHLIGELHSSAIELAAVDGEVFWGLRKRWMAWT